MDAFGHRARHVQEPFQDIRSRGRALSLGERGGVSVPIGFAFRFYGETYTSVGVTTEGYLTFGGPVTNTPLPLGDPTAPNAVIAPFWANFDLTKHARAGLHFVTLGATPARRFIVQWSEAPLASDPSSRLTFQVELAEGLDRITFRYAKLRNGDGSTGGPAGGGAATIGIEDPTGTVGLTIGRLVPALVREGDAFVIERGPPPPGPAVGVRSGVAAPGTAVELPIDLIGSVHRFAGLQAVLTVTPDQPGLPPLAIRALATDGVREAAPPWCTNPDLPSPGPLRVVLPVALAAHTSDVLVSSLDAPTIVGRIAVVVPPDAAPGWDPGNVGNAYTFAWNNPTSLSDPEGNLATSLAIRTFLRTSMRTLLKFAKQGLKFGLRMVGEALMEEAQSLAASMLLDFLGASDLEQLLIDAIGNGQLGLVYGGNTGTEAPLGGLDAYDVVGESFSNCFLARTLVETVNRGRIRVEEVQEGDHIAPPPGHDGCTNPHCGRVERLFHNVTSEVVTITAVTRPRSRERRAAATGAGEETAREDGEPPSASPSQTIRCTPGHPFFVEGRGWVFAGDLRVGDLLEADGERVEVGAVETRAERAQTFNFEVACHHTYRVAGGEGQSGLLVHNRSARWKGRKGKLRRKRARRERNAERRAAAESDARRQDFGAQAQYRPHHGGRGDELTRHATVVHPELGMSPEQYLAASRANQEAIAGSEDGVPTSV